MLTVADPSPTAEATRLPEPWRASPAANMPGTLVSNRNGSRASVQPAGGSSVDHQVAAGENEALRVALDEAGHHRRARRGADEDEHRGGRDLARRAPLARSRP